MIDAGHKENTMLTVKQEKFVQELVKGKSQREAYRASYDAEKMKDATVDKKASLLFQKGEIRGRYNELMDKAKAIGGHDAASMRAFIIEQLTKIATGEGQDTSEVYDAEGQLMQSRKGSRQIDRISALNKLAELYGIAGEKEKEQTQIILQKSEGYEE